MWGFKGNRTNSQGQSNKARGGNIKGSTIEVNGGDATQAVILKELLEMKSDFNEVTKKFNKRIDRIEVKQGDYIAGFNHYVKNNGVAPEVKAEVTELLNKH